MRHRSASDWRRARTWHLALCALAVALVGMPDLSADEIELGKTINDRVKEIFELRKDAVVRIEAVDQHGKLSGTGFYADPSGTIYTHEAVIGDASEITVFQGLRKFPAKHLLTDPRTGIALIKVEANTPFLPIGNSNEIEVAMPVIAIGFPRGMAECPSIGMVAGFDIEFLNRFFRTTHMRVNLPVQRGLGGAPVMDMEGRAVGIIISGIDGNAGCYVLPINAAEKVRLDFVRFGELRPGWLGVSVEAAPESDGVPTTARIADLLSDTPAALSGIRDGDLLLRIGDVEITRPEDVIDGAFFLSAGDLTSLTVLRDGEMLEFKLKATAHPELRMRDEPENLPAMGQVPEFRLDD